MITETKLETKDINPGIEHNNISILPIHRRHWMSLMMVLTDIFSLILAMSLAFRIRFFFTTAHDEIYIELFFVLVIFFILAAYRKNLYPAVGMSYPEELRHTVSTTCMVFLMVICFTFLVKTSQTYSRIALMVAWAFAIGIIPFDRYLVKNFLCRLKLWGEPVAIIGGINVSGTAADYFKNNPHMGIKPVLVLSDKKQMRQADTLPERDVRQIRDYINRFSLNTALVIVDNPTQIISLNDQYRFLFNNVIFISHKEHTFLTESFEVLDLHTFVGLQVKHHLLDPWSQWLKRSMDIIGSLLGLIFLSPVFLALSVLIKIDSPGSAFYRQRRVGKDGRVYDLLKFRTMYRNGDEILAQKMDEDFLMRQEWDLYQKIKDDPRITRVGRFLRAYSLDELPQLWNIFIGEMSLVGPRPIMIDQQEKYGYRFKDYICVLPGLTGLWQVSGRNQTAFNRRVQLDYEYIQKWSLWLDIYIILKTVRVVLSREGAY